MGYLDKWLRKFAPGGGGDRIVRTKTTYGKNLDRSVDMNGLINDIQNNSLTATSSTITDMDALISTNTTTNNNQNFLLKTAQQSGKTRGQVDSGLTMVAGQAGKAYIPIAAVVCAAGGASTAETSNESLAIKWDDGASGFPMLVSKFMVGVTIGGRYATYQFYNNSGGTGHYNPGTTDALDGKALVVTGSGTFNGDWVLQGIWIMYAEINCSTGSVFTTIS
tara:strand:- start:35137 stop:35799 length:663 start_codon:yes stop_codon:yes gene_type:complete